MKINELLVESQQLDEGPFTQAIGKGAGKVARGIANIGKDLKTGFKAGYSDEQPPAATAKTATTAQPKSGGGFIDQFKKGFNQGRGDAGTAQTAPVKQSTTAVDPATADKVSQTLYAQVKANVGKLDKKGKQRILAFLQKSLDVTPEVKPTVTPAVDPTAAQSQVAVTNPETVAKKGRKKKAAPDQATINADRDRLMGNFSDSIERHKQRMVAESFANGTINIFKR
jgi:hypothetical protein